MAWVRAGAELLLRVGPIEFSISGAAQRHNSVGAFGGRACAELRPGVHERRALSEQVAAMVGGLNLVADRMGERHFDNVIRVVGPLCCPVAKAAAHTVQDRKSVV